MESYNGESRNSAPCWIRTSTAAERIAQEYGAYYFKVDDHLSELIKQAADNGSAVCNAIQQMSPEEIWMREPEVQCKEEFEVYRDIAPFVFDMIRYHPPEYPIQV